ncbi:MAG TPA: hypothetical protein VGZ02_17290 [Candidatus Baltobacteraceae bacterium]|jgi:hypothetical protein|nr:hypothetical protein [Candidatus Baltobacteraceae bacterium]
MRSVTRNLCLAAISAVLVAPALPSKAESTPPPGGANQISAMSGRVGQRIFNGVLRVTVQTVHDATADDHPEKDLPSPGQKIIVMRVLLNNGSPGTFDALMIYTLADADSITKTISQPYVHPAGLNIEQGASALQTVHVPVDKDYKPVKLLIECGGCPVAMHFRPLRITIPSTP